MSATLLGSDSRFGHDDESSTTAAEEFAGSVSVGMTEGRGRGLFASRAMAKGDTVLIERCDQSPRYGSPPCTTTSTTPTKAQQPSF